MRRRIRLGMVGGGQGAFIGEVHRIAARRGGRQQAGRRRDAACGILYGTLHGMKDGPIATIDRAGRVVVPKQIREKAGLAPGTRLAVRFREGRVELEPEPSAVRLERRGSLLVAVHEEEGPAVTVEQVRDTLEQIRRREV